MKLFEAKQQPDNPEKRHLELVRGATVEKAERLATMSLADHHHGQSLGINPSAKPQVETMQNPLTSQYRLPDYPAQAPANPEAPAPAPVMLPENEDQAALARRLVNEAQPPVPIRNPFHVPEDN